LKDVFSKLAREKVLQFNKDPDISTREVFKELLLEKSDKNNSLSFKLDPNKKLLDFLLNMLVTVELSSVGRVPKLKGTDLLVGLLTCSAS